MGGINQLREKHMMAYLFVKRGGNCELHGVECAEFPPELLKLQTELSQAGYEPATSSEYEAQLLEGAKAVGEDSGVEKTAEVLLKD